jgi:uracil DNA glycosylase
MNFNIIHHSWKPLLSEFNTDAFLTFKNEILPKEKYYPEADKVFRVFSIPVSKIKVVILGSYKQANIRALEEQGVFILPFSLTFGVTIEHEKYWEPFIKKVIYFIARRNPCIWLLSTTKAQGFAANLPVKTIFNVLKYTDETIQHIPINVSYNYVFKGIYLIPAHINTLLEKKGLQKINF